MPVKNIHSLKYFIEKWDTVDPEYDYTVPYNNSVDTNFKSLSTEPFCTFVSINITINNDKIKNRIPFDFTDENNKL